MSLSPPDQPPRKKHRSLAQGVAEGIIARIRAGELAPGDKLPTESAIMSLYEVSRTVVREAISHLQAAGMVETKHGIGTFVLDPATDGLRVNADTVRTVRDVLDILELRITLETEAAGMAAQRRSPDQMREISAALEGLRGLDVGSEGSIAADQRFHLAVATASGNRYFASMLSDLGRTIIPRARLNSVQLAHAEPAVFMARLFREHEDIHDAIQRQDADGARAAMRIHLGNSRERLRRAEEALSH